VRTALETIADARAEPAHFTSGGLGTIARPLTLGLVASYLDTRLRTCVRVDAATAVVALKALRSGADLDAPRLAWLARTPSPVLRAAALTAGRHCLRLLRVRWPRDPATLAVADLADAPRPIVAAALGSAVGLSDVQVAWLIAYDDVQTVTAAARRLSGIADHDLGTAERAVSGEITDLVRQVARAVVPADIPVVPATLLEQWIRHTSPGGASVGSPA
jgi:urease accessory protein